jgi:hypothetical protein
MTISPGISVIEASGFTTPSSPTMAAATAPTSLVGGAGDDVLIGVGLHTLDRGTGT